jgi:DNA polymerase III subunit gamma/tau
MSYTALARKWRPKSFAELTGQEHVLRALSNALDSGRVHHAFLFAGTRGVGKTTIARILAKCLNCERGVSSQPCGVCAACVEIDAGRNMDVIEVDAASQTKVEETRELLENVQYAPGGSRYKVYLIDEVHMLSSHSFNALLKTLEEPPPHVKFLLATTDPQRLPATVLSRCLQFNLKRLSVALIAGRLKFILDAEKIASEPAAIQLLAQAGDGSLRDALSLLDQLLAFGGGKVQEADARSMLGTVDRAQVDQLLQLLAAGDLAALMQYASELDQWSPDYSGLLLQLASVLERVALQQALPDYAGDELHEPAMLRALAAAMSAADVQLYYQTAIMGRRDLPFAPDPRAAFRMTLLRMQAFRPGGGEASGAAPATPTAGRVAPVTSRGAAAAAPRHAEGSARIGREWQIAAAPAATASASLVGGADTSAGAPAAAWADIIAALELGGAARMLASHCQLAGISDSVVRLTLDARNATVHTAAQEDKLAQALSRHFGRPLRLLIERGSQSVATPAREREQAEQQQREAARAAFAGDPVVRSLQAQFGATIHPESVRPLRKN